MAAIVTLNQDSPSVQYLCKKDKRLTKVISMVGPITYEPHTDNPFPFLIHEIIEQMLSIKAGAKIYGRFEELCAGQITPESISKLSVEEIKAIGTSTAKANYIKNAASAVLTGELDFTKFPDMTDEAALKELVSLRGIGTWTAKMYLIFVLDRQDIQKENSKAFSAMVQFIRDYIDESLYKQLARNLLGLIQEDSSIPTNEKFFIWPKWVEKQSLITRTEINLPDLLLGIWHYIAINRSNENIKGADTYHSWYPVNPKEYKGCVGADIKQELQVTCSNTSHQSASASVLDGENNQSSEKAYEADDSSTTEENNYSKTQIIQNATIVNQHGEKNIHITHVDTLII